MSTDGTEAGQQQPPLKGNDLGAATLETVEIATERFPLRDVFKISRGAKTHADVITVTLRAGPVAGHGECVPYARYQETLTGTSAAISDWAKSATGQTLDQARASVQSLPPSAARNAIDCALWDLSAKRTGITVATQLGIALDSSAPLKTCLTISLATPEAMAAAARKLTTHPVLKLKLGGSDWARDAERMAVVREARPDAALIVDANEGWPASHLETLFEAATQSGIALIEQPLPARDDAILSTIDRPVLVCADEALDPGANVSALADRYDAVNIKLDKAGGLTAALEQATVAQQAGLKVMIGSMVSTSLSMAPAFMLAQCTPSEFVDLDSPALLLQDRENGMQILPDGDITPPLPLLWG